MNFKWYSPSLKLSSNLGRLHFLIEKCFSRPGLSIDRFAIVVKLLLQIADFSLVDNRTLLSVQNSGRTRRLYPNSNKYVAGPLIYSREIS